MKKAMESFYSSRNFPAHSAKLGVSCAFSSDIAEVAELFSQLQDSRQLADYDIDDTAGVVGLSWASDCVDKAMRLFVAWDRAKSTEEAKFFLASLVFGNRWSK